MQHLAKPVMSMSFRSAAQLAAPRVVALLTFAFLCVLPATLRSQAASGTFATVHGVVVDSVHGGELVGALVRVDTTHREATTDANGVFSIDSIPPGVHRLVVIHPLLDTLGISLVTGQQLYAAGETKEVTLSVPSSEHLVSLFCPAARRAMGPAALVGFVRDPDSDSSAKGAKVSLLFYESDPLGLTKVPRVREYTIGADAHYRICGLPANMSGKVQVFRGTVSSGEVPVEVKDGFLVLRSLSVASASSVKIATAAPDSAGKQPKRVIRGAARVTGRIVNKMGQPVAGARVDIEGLGAATLTKANGDFALDSLPSGTQTLEIRKLGYAVTEQPVELSAYTPQRVTVQMSDFVPTLETVRVQAKRDKSLFDVGFTQRQKTGLGYYLSGDRLNKNTTRLTDALRTVPGIHIVPAGDGQNVIQSSRDPNGGCVNIFVDGSPWQQQFPGDLDSFIRPDELGAIESYSASTVPAQFTIPGQGSCETLVIWTERRLNRK